MIDVELVSADTAVDPPPTGERRRYAGFTAAELQTGSVFVTTGGVRARALRWSGYLIGTLTVLWLVALIAGAVGAGRLPAVPFPAIGALHEMHSARAQQHAAPRPTVSGGIAGRGLGALRGAAPDGFSRTGSAISAPTGVRFTLPRAEGRSAPDRGVGLSAPPVVSPQPAAGAPSSGAAQPVAPPASGAAPRTTSPPAAGRGSGAASGRRSSGAAKAPAGSPRAGSPAAGGASGAATPSRSADPATLGSAHRRTGIG